ncbi:MAG: hypothetical protein IJS14_09410 [Lentisphaeria bacterium]|nr:hypothetical protein [Lentisphaeria bacterium]
MPKLFLLLPLLLLGGCFLFPDGPSGGSSDLYRDRVAAPRTERQLAKKELVLAICPGPQTDLELAKANEIAKKHQLKLTVIRVSGREALPPMLRAGRADLIAASFTPDELRQLLLEPVGGWPGKDLTSGGSMTTYCFGARRDDRELAGLFGQPEDIAILPSGKMPETSNERNPQP